MLKLSRVSGMPWDDFVAFWAARDLYMDVNVDLYNTVIRGSSPSYDLPALMRALRAVVAEREFDDEAFKLYKREQWLGLRDSKDSRRVVDSLMCPGYRYSKIKSSGKLSDALPDKAETLFDEMFSKINDGIIVLVGDIDESLVRKQLREYLGAFPTRRSAPVRPFISYHTLSGYMTHESLGRKNAIYLAMSVPMPLTGGNCAVSDVASMVLKKKLSSALVGTGMFAKVYADTRITPNERFNVLIVLEEVPGAGRVDAEEAARRVVRSELSEEGLAEITDVQVDACKTWLKHNRQVKEKSPEYWVNALLFRYLDGKDFTTGYAANVDAVSSEDVIDLLMSLNKSGKVEYIIRKK
jgi:predicted Zn-dependent peptidase